MRDFSTAYANTELYDPAKNLMSAFGEAMWAMAQIKEILWYEVGYENVKEFFHRMEHSYGDHIDEFKALLAQIGLPLIYPDIKALGEESLDLRQCFEKGIEKIDRVNVALSDFIEATDNAEHEPLARQAESIQIDNYKPRAIMAQAMVMAENGSATSFDNWFGHLVGEYNG